jgi:twitching motility protein PilT
MEKIKVFLKTMVDNDASDLFVKAGQSPYLRILGAVVSLDFEPLSLSDMELIIKDVLTSEQISMFKEKKELDFVLDIADIGRFRGNLFLDRQTPVLVFRHVKQKILDFSQLNLPAVILEKLSLESRGLVLLTGAIGSGKSTTIASMIEYINQHRSKHILAIEEPVEFIFKNKKSFITQREVGFDTLSYAEALRHSVYQSPDVLFIGTIRDAQTMATAINAAETGQLVLSTIHSINAPQTVERIMNFFPLHQHDEVRMQLSLLLKGIISMRLLPRRDQKSRIPAIEVMVWTPTIAALIREGKINELNQYIESGAFLGMQSFQQSLARLYLENKISLDTAKEFADKPEELALFIRGVKRLDGTIG